MNFVGHTDKLRKEISNNSPMPMRMTCRVVISYSVLLFFLVVQKCDVQRMYMQYRTLMRNRFTEPPPEASVPVEYLLKVVLPRYGLEESRRYFFGTYYTALVEKLNTKPAAHDYSFLSKVEDDTFAGHISLVADDSLNIGNQSYQSEERKYTSSFITKTTVEYSFRLFGTFIERTGDLFYYAGFAYSKIIHTTHWQYRS